MLETNENPTNYIFKDRPPKYHWDNSMKKSYTQSRTQLQKFLPRFNKRFGHVEKLLTMHKPKNVLSAGSLSGPLVPSPQSKCPQKTFILPQTHHASGSNMLS